MVGEDLGVSFTSKTSKRLSARKPQRSRRQRPFPRIFFVFAPAIGSCRSGMHCRSQATAGHMAHCGLHIGPTLRRCPGTQCAPGHGRVRADGTHSAPSLAFRLGREMGGASDRSSPGTFGNRPDDQIGWVRGTYFAAFGKGDRGVGRTTRKPLLLLRLVGWFFLGARRARCSDCCSTSRRRATPAGCVAENPAAEAAGPVYPISVEKTGFTFGESEGAGATRLGSRTAPTRDQKHLPRRGTHHPKTAVAAASPDGWLRRRYTARASS